MTVSGVLALTTRKSEFVDDLGFVLSQAIAKDLSQEDLKILYDGMRKGLDNGDWKDLVNHRACTYDNEDRFPTT